MELNEESLKKVLRLTYISAGLTAAGKDYNNKSLVQFLEDRFEEYYALNKKSFHIQLSLNVKGATIYVHPITPYVRSSDEVQTGQKFMFEQYGGYEGTIIGPAMNGEVDAYKVRISGDGVHFITTTINTTDIFPLEDKRDYNASKQE